MNLKSITFIFSIFLVHGACSVGVQVPAPSQNYKASANITLQHLVFFNIKDNADEDDLINKLHSLSGIEQVLNLQVGNFLDLKDQRAMSEFELSISMGFASEADYKIYQDHPIHLNLKASLADVLEGPPVTYDYLIR